MAGNGALERYLKRDRLIVLVGLGGVIALAWIYLVVFGGGIAAAATAPLAPWTAAHFVLIFLMWVVMMVGMMLPSAAPMILLFALVARKSADRDAPMVATGVFVAGYVAAWTGFGLLAALLQWGLDRAALLSPMMASASPVFGGVVLMAAGIYQWTPLKERCLGNCRAPMSFLTHGWRPGRAGALRMGLEHGLYCVGCCWVLMGLLFVGGVMNLLWIAAIAGFVMLEKLASFGVPAGRFSGFLLIVAGLMVIGLAG